MFIPNNSIVPKLQTAEDLQGDALLHYDAEIELMNLILLSIPNDIYNYVDAYTSAKDMWKQVERPMRGTIQNKVDRGTCFTNEFDQFGLATQGKHCLQPKWLKYVTQVRLAKHLTVDTFDDLFYCFIQNTSSYYVTHPTSVVDYDDEYQQDDVHTNSEDPLASAMLVNIQSRNSGNAGRNNRRAYVQEEIVEGSNAPNETGNVQRTLRTSSSGNGYTDEAGVILTDEQNDFLFADATRMEEIDQYKHMLNGQNSTS
ncbi:hypothetical protein Tco_1243278 [Tanacetum coccineum]